jgi:hypothetical protein
VLEIQQWTEQKQICISALLEFALYHEKAMKNNYVYSMMSGFYKCYEKTIKQGRDKLGRRLTGVCVEG